MVNRSSTSGSSVADGVPEPGGVGWWLCSTLLLVQCTILAWRRFRPRTVALTVAAAVPVSAAAGLGAAIGLSSFAVLVAAANAGEVRPRVARTFPLEEARAAQEAFEAREQVGKLVLLP